MPPHRTFSFPIFVLVVSACAVSQVSPITSQPAQPISPSHAPVGEAKPSGQILFTSERDGNSEIYLMSAGGGDPVNLTRDLAEDSSGSWSPDGSRIAFLSDRTGKAEVFAMDADGSNLLQLTDDREGGGWWPPLDWSPDGGRMLVTRSLTYSDAWSQAQVQVVEADGSGWRSLYPQQRMAHNDYLAEWLPLGKGVDFLTFRYTSNAVFTVSLDGSPPRGLFVRGSEPVLAFAGSPNGEEVALVTRGPDQRGQQFDYRTILRLLGRGSGVEFATPNVDRLDSMGEFELVWSPQGDRIAFPATQLHGRRELWVWFRECPTDLDRCLVPLTDLGGVDGRPSWSPDGRWLAFASGPAEAFDIYAVNVPEYWSPHMGPKTAIHLASSEGWDFAPAWRP